MKRVVPAISVVAMLALAGAGYKKATSNNSAALVSVRDRLFTRWVPETEFMKLAYSAEQRPGGSSFRTDPQLVRARFGRQLARGGTPIISAHASNDLTGAIAVLSQLRGSGGIGCGTQWLLSQKVAALVGPQPYGCCSDFAVGFIVLAELQGIEARKVVNADHTFVEFYDRDRDAWVFLDPQFGLLASANGQLLSAWELRDAIQHDVTVRWTFLEKGVSRVIQEGAVAGDYNKESFREFRLVLEADVILQDENLKRVSFMQKPGAQLIAHLAFNRPGFLGTRDSSSVRTFVNDTEGGGLSFGK